MALGKIKKIVSDRGFGFIQSEDGSDVFFHCSTVSNRQFENLAEGQRVEYTLDPSTARGSKGPRATSVTPI